MPTRRQRYIRRTTGCAVLSGRRRVPAGRKGAVLRRGLLQAPCGASVPGLPVANCLEFSVAFGSFTMTAPDRTKSRQSALGLNAREGDEIACLTAVTHEGTHLEPKTGPIPAKTRKIASLGKSSRMRSSSAGPMRHGSRIILSAPASIHTQTPVRSSTRTAET